MLWKIIYMEKNQIVKLVSRIKERFPDEFFRLTKEEKYEYIKTFENLFIKYDFDLVDKAITRIFKMRYLKAPTFMQMQLYVSRMLFERRSEVFIKMQDNGYYKKNISGTPEEINEKHFKICDDIAIEFLKDEISPHHKLEIERAVKEYDCLKEYRGLILFDENLPVPPGCDPNKNWDFSLPTCHLNTHK